MKMLMLLLFCTNVSFAGSHTLDVRPVQGVTIQVTVNYVDKTTGRAAVLKGKLKALHSDGLGNIVIDFQ